MFGHEDDGEDPRPTNEDDELELAAIIIESIKNVKIKKNVQKRQ